VTRMTDFLRDALPELPEVRVSMFGHSSWTLEGFRNAVWQDFPDCLDGDGEIVGFGISPNHVTMQMNNRNFLPEDHGETVIFQKSMADPSDWFPIPDGCFFDSDADGTPSNPALKRFGRHFEMLNAGCLGNHTEQEQMRICLTICSHVDYGEQSMLDGQADSAIDQRCMAVNYDEHGFKGHCHLYPSHDFRVYGFHSTMCESVRGINHNDICVQPWVLTPRPFSSLVNLPSLASPSSGINNTLGIFCHFNTLHCTETGYHAKGVSLLADGSRDSVWDEPLTEYIPKIISTMNEEDESPLFGLPGGAGRPGACKPCAAKSFSVRVIKNFQNRSLIPRPDDYPGTVNVCQPCPPGRYCRRGVGCEWKYDETSCPPRCPKGHYCAAEVDEGMPCGIATYQDEDGQESCKMCPTGHTFALGSTGTGSCLCKNGERRFSVSSVTDITDTSPCVPCLPGMICEWAGDAYIPKESRGQFEDYARLINEATNFQTVPFLEVGYWADLEEPEVVYQCSTAAKQQDCLGGALTLPTNTTMERRLTSSVQQCRGLTEGKLCNMCPSGYMKDVKQGGCAECGGAATATILVLIPVGVIGFCIAYLVSAKMINIQKTKVTTGPKGLDMAIGMVLLGRVVQTAQLISLCSDLAIPWPSSVRQVMDSTSFIKLDLDGMQIGCAVRQSAFAAYFVKSIIIVLTVLFLPICCFFSKLLPEAYRMSWAVTLHVCGTILTILFLSFTTVGFAPFVCLSHPAEKAGTTMSLYPHISCWGEDHTGMVVVGLLVLSSQVASVCLIAYACFMLPKYSVNAQNRDDVMVSVKFVWSNYRADVWFYSCLMLLRNLVTAFVPAISPNDPSIQLAIMTQSLICSFALHCYLWPWHMPLCNAMDFVSLSCCLSIVVLAAAYLPRTENKSFFEIFQSVLMLFGMVGGLVVAVLSFLLMSPPAKKQTKLQQAGVQMHLMGEPPHIDDTAVLLHDSTASIITKSKADMVATIKDLDAYDKRSLMMLATMLDSEFYTMKQSREDAPMPMKRIKSTTSLEASLEAAAEVGGVPANEVKVVTV